MKKITQAALAAMLSLVFALPLAGVLTLAAPPFAVAQEAGGGFDPADLIDRVRKADLSMNASLAAMSAIEFDRDAPGPQVGLGAGWETESGQPGLALGAAIPLGGGAALLSVKGGVTSGGGEGSFEGVIGAAVTLYLGG